MAKKQPIPERVQDFGAQVLQVMQDTEDWGGDLLEEIKQIAYSQKLLVTSSDMFVVLPEVRSAMGITAPVPFDEEE
jgi:hypothetical protein